MKRNDDHMRDELYRVSLFTVPAVGFPDGMELSTIEEGQMQRDGDGGDESTSEK